MAKHVAVPEEESPVLFSKQPDPIVPPVAPPAIPPVHVQTITVEAFARTQSVYPAPIVRAFVTIEKTNFVVRKLSADEWQKLFGEFLATERR